MRRWQPTILVYLLVMNLTLLCFLFPTLAFFMFNREGRFHQTHLDGMLVQMQQALEHRSSAMAHSLALSAGQAIVGYNYSFLNTMFSKVVTSDPELVYCYVMDLNRQVVAHHDPEKLGIILEDETSREVVKLEEKVFLARLIDEARPTKAQFYMVVLPDGNRIQRVLEAVAPVYSGGSLVGFLRYGVSLKGMIEETAQLKKDWAEQMQRLKMTLVTISAFFFLVGGLISLLFTRTFVHSVRVLNEGVARVANGNLEHVIQQRGLVCTEFTQLSESFNDMTEKLRLSHRQLEEYSKNLEQKVLERTRDLKMAQARLLKQAHEAGMAEMAVGILHNIGNAITPAKVSTALLLKKIESSSIRNYLSDIVDKLLLLLVAPDSLSPEDRERYRKAVSLLPDSVNEEYTNIFNEIKKIRDKHDHIESIIQLQLRYARLLTNEKTMIAPGTVVNDALEMLEEDIRKYSVKVTKNLADLPPVRIEQPKLLQIMINLIKNSLEAMTETDQDQRRLVITGSPAADSRDYVVLSVSDTGIGFGPEEQNKLFSYGFTTKERGSGFGLHSCANFLIAQNGKILARSDGPGKGATFDVYLPLTSGKTTDGS